MTTLIDATLIVPGNNDRTVFNSKRLKELADSIQENGLIQPITVRPIDDTELYQIIAGERRYRAIELLGWSEVPCIIADANEQEASIAMLIENVQRADLDPIDEANAYASRMAQYGWTIDDLSQKTGLSKIRIQFRIKLLNLRSDIQALVSSSQLQLGYAQIISDTGLDANFQALAIRQLRDNPNPSPAWFRRICGKLLEQQSQINLFDAPLFGGPIFDNSSPKQPQYPPLPSTTIPPKSGKSPKEVLTNQATFWQQAAQAWEELGKPFKRQECEAAAKALQSAMMFV